MSEVTNFAQKVGNMFGNATGYNQYSVDPSVYMPNAQEQTLTDALMAQAQGTGGPSAAQLQMQAGVDQASNQAMGVAAAQRGMSPALAARQAQQAGAQMSQQANQQAGILRAQEQLNAQQAAGSMLASQRNARMQAAGIDAQGFEGAADRSAGAFKSLGSALATGGTMSSGGIVPGYAEGGMVAQSIQAKPDFLNALAVSIGQNVAQNMTRNPARAEGTNLSGLGSKVSTYMDSGSGGGAPTGSANGLAQVLSPTALSNGGTVPGNAKVPGDSLKNDVVDVKLSPGEIVVPRTVAAKSPEEITSFIMALKGAA